MVKEFNYKPGGFKISDFASIAIAIALIVVPVVMPFDLTLKRLVILTYPYTMYLMIVIGIALLVYQIMRLNKEAKLRKVARPIIVDGDIISFVKVGSKGVEECSINLQQDNKVEYDSEDEILTITTSTGKFKFDCDYFENPQRFAEFCKLFEK